mgnify:CR=1 FL=1
MKDIDFKHHLAIKYFEGEILPEEEKSLFEFLDNDQKAMQQFRQWEETWINQYIRTTASDAQWEKMYRRMQISQSINPPQAPQKIWLKAMSIAAIITVAILTAWNIIYPQIHTDTPSYFLCSAAYGEKSKVILADGTSVWLNAGSSLRYSDQFSKGQREVYLKGEGYFEVNKKEEQNFIVHTDIYDVIVKGTKFNVSAYEDDPTVSTTLIEGSVDITYDHEVLELLPGEKINFIRHSKQFVRSKVDAEQSKAWADNRIEYSDITLQELIVKLSRQYDVSIQLAPSAEPLSDKSFHISLRNGETIEDVLSALKAILPITVERTGQQILIK